MIEDTIEKFLGDVRPSLQADGGDVDFVNFEKETGTVFVKLKGTCHGCPMAQITIKQGIEKYLTDNIPEVKTVEQK